MYRVKQLLGGRLSLRNYHAQVGETYAMIKALNKLTGLSIPEAQYVVYELLNSRQFGFRKQSRIEPQ